MRTIPEARNSDRNKKLRREFVQEILRRGIDYMNDCVFIDETGFRKKHVQRRGYSLRGQPCIVESSNDPGINISIIGCVSSQGPILLSKHAQKSDVLDHHEQIGKKRSRKAMSHGTTSTHYHDFIKDLLVVMKRLNLANKVLILDNCSIHKGGDTAKLIENAGHKLLFLSPYSPFLNPIEKLWKQLKDRTKRYPSRTDDELVEKIKVAASRVKKAHCEGYIRNALTFFDPSLNLEDIYHDQHF